MSILPESEIKTELQNSINMYIQMMKLMSKGHLSEEEINLFESITGQWSKHLKEKLPWIKATNTTHTIAVHVVEFLKQKDLPLTLLDFSCEGFEGRISKWPSS